MIYSPFTDENGMMLPLEKIEYSHLAQLQGKGITEGYKIEYKEFFDESLKKKHLCKEVSSFANSDGGWLFIGVKDDGEIVDIEIDSRTDFDVTITNILKSRVSPIPEYSFKILINPDDKTKCVLVLYIPPSRNTPFVADGTVYVRNGSSAISATRSDIDSLYFKRKELSDWIVGFCNHNLFDSFSKELSHCYIYLFNPEQTDKLSTLELDRLCDSANPSNIQLSNRSTNSVIFYNSKTTDCTSFFEYFDDHNIKFGIPMVPYKKYENIIPDYLNKNLEINVDNFFAIDGYTTLENISLLITNAFELLEKYGKDIKKYSFIFEFRNIQNTYVLFSEQLKEQFELFKEKGFRYCRKQNVQSRDWQIINMSSDITKYGYALSIASMVMGNTFGYTLEEFVGLFAKAQEKHKDKNGNISGSVRATI